MNYITLAIVGLTLMPILFGVLLGLLRGSRRALLRLVLVVVSIALAFALTGVVTKSLINMNIESIGGSIVDVLQQGILSNLPSGLADYTIPLAQSILQVVVFLLLFFVLWLLTWLIVFPICQIFVKPKRIKDDSGKVVKVKKHRLIGAAIGAVQGIIVAVIVCIVFTGLLVQTDKIVNAAADLTNAFSEVETTEGSADNSARIAEGNDLDDDIDEGYTYPDSGASSNEQTGEENPMEMLNQYTAMITQYVDSPFGKMYNAIGAKPFEWITTVKVNDTKVTFSSQVDIICNIAHDVSKLAKEFINLQNFDFYTLFEDGNVESLQELFDRLDGVINDLSDETKAIIDEMIGSLASQGGLDIGDMKFTDINFHKEGQIIGDMYQYSQKDELTMEDANDIVEKLADSDIIFGIVNSQDFDVSSKMNDEQLDVVSQKIDEMAESGNISQSKIDALRDLFGLDKPETVSA